MNFENAIKFVRLGSQPQTRMDHEFLAIRQELGGIVERYQQDQTDPDLIRRVWALVLKLEEITEEDTTGHTHERAVTNTVVTSSRIKRTHFAAYMAGKISMYDTVGDKFKSWVHNAAANGAISVGDLLDDILLRLKAQDRESENYEIVKVFRNAAFEDAARLLDCSVHFDPSSPLTQYNKAKLDILSKERHLREEGIEKLLEIQGPQDDCHPAELAWHQNNYDMFNRVDKKMAGMIQTQDGDKYVRIEHGLKRNSDVAKSIESNRGNIWQNQTKQNRLVVVGSLVGIGVAGVTPFVDPESAELLKQVLAYGVELVVSYLDTGTETQAALSPVGDGGLAVRGAEQMSLAASEMIRATFGDGGLA